jgi:hypothetical protein
VADIKADSLCLSLDLAASILSAASKRKTQIGGMALHILRGGNCTFLMVRSASSRVSNHEAPFGPSSFETAAMRPPQDEVLANALGFCVPDALAFGQHGNQNEE